MINRFFLFFTALLLLVGCRNSDPHFLTNKEYREQVFADFEEARKVAEHRDADLFAVLDQQLSTREREALMFLYAYMPLNDMADYDGLFFLRNVKLAFAAMDSLPWGKTIPEDVFRHFVLPYRVNNENLDSARGVFFRELLPRVRNLTMKEAALEVNHWCHEKVNYRGTDGRTISPLGAVCTAYGRCGEESTFATTALRSVGIPARQVYTPRWAHTDDNHAWVEVWVDGKWSFLGACEPAPDLNQGWFAGPALRTMMVHTNAFGRYQGPEKVLKAYPKYARLNLLENYAPVKKVVVKIVEPQGDPAPGATVEFGLYNYAEFYPLHSALTDSNGCASLETGYGDLMVWASNGHHFNMKRLTVETVDTLLMKLERRKGDAFDLTTDNVPPVAKEPAKVTESGQRENDRRLAVEDSIREAYIATFIKRDDAAREALELQLDSTRVWPVLNRSRGNWKVVLQFLRQTEAGHRPLALLLLETIAEKDLHDTPLPVLTDHLTAYIRLGGNLNPTPLEQQYLFNPRVDLEMLTPYRSVLADTLKSIKGLKPSLTVENLTRWMAGNISIDSANNYYRIRISPVGVLSIRRADKANRDLFFVAACRSLGIAARLEPATRVPQYFDSTWMTVQFNAPDQKPIVAEKGFLTLQFDKQIRPEPLYYIHFSLARFTGNSFRTLEFEEMKPVGQFQMPVELEPGYYRLLTGNRLDDGTVLVRQVFFELEKDEHKVVELVMRHEAAPLKTVAVWSRFPLQLQKPAIVGWIDPATEPGRHFLVDLQPVKESFVAASIPLLLYTRDEQTAKQLTAQLPANTQCLVDANWDLAIQCASATGLKTDKGLPAFIVVKPDGQIVYYTSGYQIGTPEQLIKVMQRLERESHSSR